MLGQVVIRHAAALIFPLVVGGCLTAGELLTFVFGPNYAPGARALCLLLVVVGFAVLLGVYRFVLIVYNRPNALFHTMAAGTVLNVVLNLMLIPGYSLVGGVFSALVSEGLIFVLA